MASMDLMARSSERVDCHQPMCDVDQGQAAFNDRKSSAYTLER